MQLFAINIASRGNLQGCFISSIRKIIHGTCLNIDHGKVQELKNVTLYMNKNKNLLCNGLTEVTITIFSQELFQNLSTLTLNSYYFGMPPQLNCCGASRK